MHSSTNGTAKASKEWFVDLLGDHWKLSSLIESRVFHAESEFQKIDVMQLSSLGKCLILDEKMQSSEVDEFIYHEALCHPVLALASLEPRTVFIGGGGEGATAREVLRFKTVEKVVMVDLDRVAVETCRKYLPRHHGGAFDDPRLELVFSDAKAYLEKYLGVFDVIIMDLCDPLDGGPATALYTERFYREVLSKKLAPQGLLVTQAGPAGLLSHRDVFTPIYRTLKQVFPVVVPYVAHVPAFNDCYGYHLCSMGSAEALSIGAHEIDERLRKRLQPAEFDKSRFYDGTTHVHMTHLPRYLRASLDKETEVITENNLRFIH